MLYSKIDLLHLENESFSSVESVLTLPDLIVGSMDQESPRQLQMWFSEHFFAPKLAGLFVTPIVSAMVKQLWGEKMSEKPHSIRLLR